MNKKQHHKKYYPPLVKVLLKYALNQQSMVPSFACTSAPAAGNDLLFYYVTQHPHIVPPLSRELFPLPRVTKRYISSHLPSKKTEKQRLTQQGTAKTGLFNAMLPNSSWVYWCKGLNDQLKTVICLRNPVDRAIDHFRQNQQVYNPFASDTLWQSLPEFDRVVEIEASQVPNGGAGFNLFTGTGSSSLLRHGIYLPYLQTLHAAVDPNSVLLVEYDDLLQNPTANVERIFDFLELEPLDSAKLETTPLKESNVLQPLPGESKAKDMLNDFYRPYNEALYQYLNHDYCW